MMSEIHVFERLERATTFIAQHPDYPGKQEVVAECLVDIDEHWQRGQLLLEQRSQLRAILLSSRTSPRQRHRLWAHV